MLVPDNEAASGCRRRWLNAYVDMVLSGFERLSQHFEEALRQ